MTTPGVYAAPSFDATVDLDLSRNEGRAPAAELLAAVGDAARVVCRYPDIASLRSRLAGVYGVDPGRVVVTAGGDDALHRCFLALVKGRAVTTAPTFEMLRRYAEQHGVELVEVWWRSGRFPAAEVAAAVSSDADVAFVVSPNNPTGAAVTATDLRRVAAAAPVVVLDAAYVEFADEDLTALALELGNVLVVRTLSKAYGLAGLRVGCLVGDPDLVARVGAFGSPYPVSALSAAVAVARLDRPVSEMGAFVAEVRRQRGELTEVLRGLGARPSPSQANFVLADCADPPWLVDGAAALGVGLRRFAGRPGLEQAVRITLPGDRADFARLTRTLRTVLAPEALLFDIDGVLADVSRSQTTAVIETARGLGVEIAPADVQRAKAEGNASNDWELTRRLCARDGVDVTLAEVTARYERLYQGDEHAPGLKQHEQPLVDVTKWRRWASRLPLGVVTGRPRSDATEVLDRFGLLGSVSALVTAEDAPPKPDPAPIRLALERLGVSRAWMVGDTPDDVTAARRAGVVPVGVVAPGDDPGGARSALSAAARVLDQICDLEELIP